MDHSKYQDIIDRAFHYIYDEHLEDQDVEASAIIDGLLDLCQECAQGFEYPSFDLEDDEEDEEEDGGRTALALKYDGDVYSLASTNDGDSE